MRKQRKQPAVPGNPAAPTASGLGVAVVDRSGRRPRPPGPGRGASGRCWPWSVRGLSNAEIAERLVLSKPTARTRVSRAIGQLGARDRAQLVVVAYQTGLVDPHPPA
jgi:DNA-binding CsgD family transcriptional regulator